MEDSLSHLQQQALAFRDARDWAQFHTPKDLVLGLASEAGELAEVLLWKPEHELGSIREDARLRGRLGEEMADVLIYLLYLAEAADIRLGEAVIKKLSTNAQKYPVTRSKGSSRKYSELE